MLFMRLYIIDYVKFMNHLPSNGMSELSMGIFLHVFVWASGCCRVFVVLKGREDGI